MAGRFEGLTDEQWKMIDPLIPEEPYIFGRPHPDRRKLLNTILLCNLSRLRSIHIRPLYSISNSFK